MHNGIPVTANDTLINQAGNFAVISCMETYKGYKTFNPKSRSQWRNWLLKNHTKEEGVFLINYKKGSGKPGISWQDTVEEALCFGWIDSVRNTRNDESYYQFFTKRKPKSHWSKINKQKIDELTAKGLMTPAGLAAVELAKSNGTWNALDGVEEIEIPADLQKAFSKNKTAFKNFEAFPRSSKKLILWWLLSAKRDETRLKRIAEIISLAAKNIRANHPTKK